MWCPWALCRIQTTRDAPAAERTCETPTRFLRSERSAGRLETRLLREQKTLKPKRKKNENKFTRILLISWPKLFFSLQHVDSKSMMMRYEKCCSVKHPDESQIHYCTHRVKAKFTHTLTLTLTANRRLSPGIAARLTALPDQTQLPKNINTDMCT